MAIVIEANYSKKVGLPAYSSHQFMVTLRTEIADLSQVEAESTRLYTLLQSSVDRELQKVGFLPQNGNSHNGNGHNGNGHPQHGNSQPPRNGNGNRHHDQWNCSPKQRQYILDIVSQHNLDKGAVENLAQERFGKPVRELNKLEASGLIEELKEQTGTNNGRQNGRANQPAPPAR